MKLYVYSAIFLALSTLGVLIYNTGKHNVVQRLQQDRVVIFQDGKRIDKSIFAADDDSLYCMLVACESD